MNTSTTVNLPKWGTLAATFGLALTLVSPANAGTTATHDTALAVLRSGAAPEIVHVVSGAMPSHAEEAVTLSDANCQPDAKDVSHCLNALKLADGRTIVVRHDHDIRYVPCLAPGEKVQVRPGAH
ncbi:MAG: hypothetical protein ACLPYS_04765 [Vulcanimicrobiaceae bacterium]|jgi:hypothetical protein